MLLFLNENIWNTCLVLLDVFSDRWLPFVYSRRSLFPIFCFREFLVIVILYYYVHIEIYANLLLQSFFLIILDDVAFASSFLTLYQVLLNQLRIILIQISIHIVTCMYLDTVNAVKYKHIVYLTNSTNKNTKTISWYVMKAWGERSYDVLFNAYFSFIVERRYVRLILTSLISFGN